MENMKMMIDHIAGIVEMIGVLIIFVGIVYSLARFLISLRKSEEFGYVALRQSLGKSILLGLEVLIAADIMATIVTAPTLQSVAILGVIVLIRTILSFSLQVELEGRFPWQGQKC
ncbi:DUF1622 domain-containing protein [Cardiobacteriaceae bacterium TAE3-ERU3]|nr:DUF1622 domain-containing protein [Cardiobacteriaceae bacterium TAE3-ERU3]